MTTARAKPKKQTVWTLTISHTQGVNVDVYRSRHRALAGLATYCREWYEMEVGEPLPTQFDQATLIERYFESVPDEWCEIDKQEVQ